MPTARRETGVAADSIGNIYAVGGYNISEGLLNNVEVYNPLTDTWIIKNPLPISRNEIGLVLNHKTGILYSAGGYNEGYFNDVYEYNSTSDTWVQKAPMQIPRAFFGLAAATNGKLYAIGGSSSNNNRAIDSVEEYNPATNTWTIKAPLPIPLTGLGVVASDNGKLYAIGGSTNDGTVVNNVEEYNPATNTWTIKAPMNYARSTLAVSLNSNGNIYAIGGNMQNSDIFPYFVQTNVVEEYNPITNIWTIKNPLPLPEMEMGAALGNDGKVHIIGGWTPISQAINANYSEQTLTNTQLSIPSMLQTLNPWQNQTYDGANFWSPSATTIGRWGCAITSYTMILNYFGIYKLPNGNTLDPGTLNTWLKNNNGYIDGKTSGFVNPVAISVLSKKTKQINNITNFDALEYSRVSGSNNTNALTDSINSNIPAILDVGGHFVVAKGINGTTFDINDPYYPDKIALTSYPNGFSYFGKLIPSNTDISYILITGNKNLHFGLKDSIGNSIGQDYLQESLIDDEANQPKGSSIQMLLVPKPSSGMYTLNITGNNGEKKFQIYLYDKDGNLKLMKEAINIKDNKSQNINIYFDKNNVKNNEINRGKNENEFEDEIKDWLINIF